MKLSVAAEIFLALGIDKWPKLRRMAANVACDYWMEMHRWGECQPNIEAMERICKRFRVGDYICALSVHYPIRKK